MTGLVLDTNVIVSALLNEEGFEAAVFDLAVNRKLAWYISEPILAEYAEVLHRSKFRLPAHAVDHALARIRKGASLVRPGRQLSVCSDEADNRFLECAETAGADYLVTGNKRHFPQRWKTTAVVSARELIELVAPGLKR